MTMGFSADIGGLFGNITIDGVDVLTANKDGSIVAATPVSNRDATVNRLLQRGDFGFGASDAYLYTGANELDTVDQSSLGGVVATSVATVNGPTGATSGVVQTIVYNTSFSIQQYWEVGTVAASTRTWVRTQNSGVWGEWYQVYRQNDIVGIVSQTGGVPTGAIIESGTNAGGHYVKFADGNMICSIVLQSSSSGVVNWNYPVNFVGPSPRITASVTGVVGIVVTGAPGLTSVTTSIYNTSNVLIQAFADYMAIGKWY